VFGRHVSALAIACLATFYAHEAGATAMIGGTISVLAGAGTCHDNHQVLGNTVQDTFTLSGATACAGGSASVDMHGDAATASIGLRGTSSGNGFGSSEAAAQVQFTDHWVLTPPTGTTDSIINIPITITLEGSISPGAIFDPSFGRFMDYNLTISDQYSPFSPGHLFSAIGSLSTTGSFTETFSGSVNFSNFNSTALPMTAVVEMSLFMPALLEGTVDFFNTASIAMDLPPGFSAVTSSGLALDFAQAPASAPEPETGALLLSGLGLLGFVARRRKQNAASSNLACCRPR
jgi:hypothetical protein